MYVHYVAIAHPRAHDFNKPDVKRLAPSLCSESFRESAPIFKYSVVGLAGNERAMSARSGTVKAFRKRSACLADPRKKACHPWNLLFIIFFDHYQQATNSPDGGRCIQNLSARRNAPSDFFVSFRLPRSLPAAIASIAPFLAPALPPLAPSFLSLFLTSIFFHRPSPFSSFSLFACFQAIAGVRQRSKAIQGRRTGNVSTRQKDGNR